VPAARASSAPLPTEVSLARIISQGLIPATAAPDVVAAVSRQLAIQGQQVSAVPHALLVRAPAAPAGTAAPAAPGRTEVDDDDDDKKPARNGVKEPDDDDRDIDD